MTPKSNSILDRISSEDALLNAWKLLNKSNKTSKGLSNVSIKDFESNYRKHISEISKALKSNKYTFSKVKGVTIEKKDGTPRPLRVPEIKDRLVHKVLALEFEKILSPKFGLKNRCSFAYQSKIGIIDAIAQMVIYYRQGYTTILEADIVKFFPSVDTGALIKKVQKALPDDSVNELFETAMKQELGNVKELEDKQVYEKHFLNYEDGLPQGNALSPLLANICLADFDQRMIDEDIKMVRYADDFIILCKNKTDAKKAYDIAIDELEVNLKLNVYPLKEEKEDSEKISRILDPRAVSFSFLSIRFDGKRCWVEEKKFKSLIDKMKEISFEEKRKKEKEEIGLLQCLVRMKNIIEGWLAAYYFVDIDSQVTEIDKHANIELYRLFKSFSFISDKKDLQQISLKDRGDLKWGLGDRQRKDVGVPTAKSILKKLRDSKDELESLIKTKLEIQEKGLDKLI